MPHNQLQYDIIVKALSGVITVLVIGFFAILWNGNNDTQSRVGSLAGQVASEDIKIRSEIAELSKIIESKSRQLQLQHERLEKEIRYVENISVNGPDKLATDG